MLPKLIYVSVVGSHTAINLFISSVPFCSVVRLCGKPITTTDTSIKSRRPLKNILIRFRCMMKITLSQACPFKFWGCCVVMVVCWCTLLSIACQHRHTYMRITTAWGKSEKKNEYKRITLLSLVLLLYLSFNFMYNRHTKYRKKICISEIIIICVSLSLSLYLFHALRSFVTWSPALWWK